MHLGGACHGSASLIASSQPHAACACNNNVRPTEAACDDKEGKAVGGAVRSSLERRILVSMLCTTRPCTGRAVFVEYYEDHHRACTQPRKTEVVIYLIGSCCLLETIRLQQRSAFMVSMLGRQGVGNIAARWLK